MYNINHVYSEFFNMAIFISYIVFSWLLFYLMGISCSVSLHSFVNVLMKP